MAIDWNKPVETCEDPRHSERVIVLFDANHKPTACKIGSAYHGMPDSEGCIKFGAHTYRLRNVVPKPVKHEGWIVLRKGTMNLTSDLIYAGKQAAAALDADEIQVRIEWEEVP